MRSTTTKNQAGERTQLAVIEQHGEIFIVDGNDEQIAVMNHYDSTASKQAAQFAAAPELLAALKWTADYIPNQDINCQAVARAAIAKAEGK